MGTRAVIAMLAACLPLACATPREDLPFKQLNTRARLEVQSLSEGLAESLLVTTLIEPEGALTLKVLGQRSWSEAGDPSLLDLRIRYEDFTGTGPVSSGRSLHEVVEYGADGEARPGQPLARPVSIDLQTPLHAMARRVQVSGRLFAVDVLDDEGHTGSQVIEFPMVTLETFRRPARGGPGIGGLLTALQAMAPEDLFLAAASTPATQREEVVGLLVAELPRLGAGLKEAALAGLLYLTGETHGRSEYRWQAWWDARRKRP